MKNLESVSKEEREDFLKSFDYVFCGVNGVLWHLDEVIPGAREALTTLKTMGKKIIFVSNDTTKTQQDHYEQLKEAGFDLEQTDLVTPSVVMVDFLKKRNFSKKIYLIGMTPLRTDLQNSGFQIEELHYSNPEESVVKYVKEALKVDEDVGAVIVDLDLNMSRIQFQKASTYLKNPEVLFITGCSDRELFLGPDHTSIGPGMFLNILEDAHGRKPHCLAKPGPELHDFIKAKFGVEDASKVLCIGDSIIEDMGFATNCGYQKLLVLSGLTSKEEFDKGKFPEEYKPKYYARSLKVIRDSLQ